MFSSGLYAEAEAGALMFLGDARRPLGTGVAVGVRLGYEIGRWLAIQGHALSATHETDFDSGPQSDQLLQVLQATGELKLSIPLGQWSVFGYGGGGSPACPPTCWGRRASPISTSASRRCSAAAAALTTTPAARHFSFGVNAAFWKLPQLYTTGAMTGTLYIRYTF
jgi:hypothetical protein